MAAEPAGYRAFITTQWQIAMML